MSDFIRIFLPIYLSIFVLTVFLLRTFIVWKKTGINAYGVLKKKGAEGILSRYFKLIPLASIFVVVVASAFPSYYTYLTPLHWLAKYPLVTSIGILLLVLSLLWILLSQTQMGNAWRIGIDSKTKTHLVNNGLFLISRNPIFLGMKINVIGFFLALPNAATFAIMLLTCTVVELQVALEEQHLLKRHGEDYVKYCKKVRRWL